MKKLIVFIILLRLVFAACVPGRDDGPDPASSDDSRTEPPVKTRAEELLESMSLEEKVGQLFLIRPESLLPGTASDSDKSVMSYMTDSMAQTLKEYPAGGIIFFAGNLTDRQSLARFMERLNEASDIPLFFAVDEEGGNVARVANDPSFGVRNVGTMGSIGATGDPSKAYEAGSYIGGYLHELGFNVDFAPVTDINSNPRNIVIGKRAFGSDRELVSGMVSSFLDGLHSQNVAGSIKHFPGHGDTSGDTHDGYVAVNKSWDELKDTELVPFRENLDRTDMVMVAHLTLPNITSDGLPASLSKELITGKLRGEMGYRGVVITDALSMGAIKKNYPNSEASIMSFLAGSDILLLPDNYVTAYEGVLEAVRSGRISEEQLDSSVMRILTLKEKYGLI